MLLPVKSHNQDTTGIGSKPNAMRREGSQGFRFPGTSSGQHQQRLGGRRELPTQPCNTTAACSDVRVSK